MTSVLVLGASGQVGRELLRQARIQSIDAIAAGRAGVPTQFRFDLSSPHTIRPVIELTRCEVTFLVAAPTNVAWCEANPLEAHRMIVGGAGVAADAARQSRSALVFFSTDYVFGGANGPSGESDPVGPLNVYGRSKLEAETIVLDANPDNLVVRTCQVFGPDPRRMNFVLRVADRLAGKNSVAAADDLFGTPTFSPDLVSRVFELVASGASGAWHVAGSAYLSRYELAVAVARVYHLDPALVYAVPWDQAHDPVNRPRRGGLRNDRLAARGVPEMTPLNDALAKLRDYPGVR
jgi:dTDP-4-dehydrorhamnose reductase